MALKENRFEDARRYFEEGIRSAEEFGRVDERARGQFGLASVYFESAADVQNALTLVDESIESFQQQGMQYEIHKCLTLQEKILSARSRSTTAPQ